MARGADGGAQTGTWKASPATEEFRRAAQTISAPATDPVTNAGLPKRRAGANLVPGSVAARPAAAAQSRPNGGLNGGRGGGQSAPLPTRPARSADEVRARMSGFQLRGRAGRTEGRQEN